MENRLDLVIFGASGYTGRFVVTEMIRICKQYPDVLWGIAGRSAQKLKRMLQEAAEKTREDTSSIRIICADTGDLVSLKAMCSQCKVLMNCCGPYAYTGEAVVRAAIVCSTHYLDVCSETMFLEKIIPKYDEEARARGTWIVPACGLGCVPADLGVIYLQQKFGGTLNSVEAYLITNWKASGKWPSNVVRNSTWEGFIEGFAEKPLWSNSNREDCKLRPILKQRPCVHKRFNRWAIRNAGAEEGVVFRTQRHSPRPIQFKRYHSFPTLFSSVATLFGGLFIFILCKVFRLSGLLIKYSRYFSFGIVTFGDPDEGAMRELSFDYEMYGVGWKGEVEGKPEDKIVARICAQGKNAPYEGTAVAVIYAALTILTESDKMPKTYGVFTPGAAFKNTSIIEKYNNDKLKFEIIET